jgi:hypothetical protein
MLLMMPLMLAAGATFDPQSSFAWAEFSADPSRGGEAHKVEIGTVPGRTEPGEYVYWLRLTTSKGGQDVVSYADTRTCSAAKEVIARMEGLGVAQGAAPHNWGNIAITADGTLYRVRMPVRYGDLTGEAMLRTNVGTPVAAFVEQSLNDLRPCWRPDLPPAR